MIVTGLKTRQAQASAPPTINATAARMTSGQRREGRGEGEGTRYFDLPAFLQAQLSHAFVCLGADSTGGLPFFVLKSVS